MKKQWMAGLMLAVLVGVNVPVYAITPVNTMATQAQVDGFYQHQFGDYQITALLDGTNYLSKSLFKGISDSQINDILKKYHADQAQGIQTSVNAFLVNDGKQLSLIDSGAARCFGAHLGSIKDNLIASGHQPAAVNHVFLTHLHPDHVCGIADNGVANYPNATLHISQQEYDYWFSAATLKRIPAAKQAKFLETVATIKAALAPYQQAKQIKLFNHQTAHIAGINIKPSQGHTPGHHSFVINQQDQQLVFIGDIVHSHTLQFDQPATAVDFDVNPEQAVQTRLQHFAQYAQQGQTIAAPHLPFPGIGHIHSKDNQHYQWIPIHFKN